MKRKKRLTTRQRTMLAIAKSVLETAAVGTPDFTRASRIIESIERKKVAFLTGQPNSKGLNKEATTMTEREKFIQGIRDVADFLEANPEFQVVTAFCAFPHNKETFLRYCKMMGSFRKEFRGERFAVKKEFVSDHPQVAITMERPREEFCTRVVTPVEVPATEEKFYEAFTVPAKPAHTKEEVTWECPEDLSLIGEAK